MLIGEVAALVGVTTRTIRHYHRVGVVPEPRRRGSGYREYGVRDVLLLLRAVRLAELGLSLPEVADALADSTGAELRLVLEDLLRDLDEQEARLAARRRAVAELLVGDDGDHQLSAAGRRVVDRLTAAGVPAEAVAAERTAWEIVDVSLDPAEAARAADAVAAHLADPAAVTDAEEIGRLFAELEGVDPQDPRVDELAGRMAGLGRQLFGTPTTAGDRRLFDAHLQELAPAQRRCLALVDASWSQ